MEKVSNTEVGGTTEIKRKIKHKIFVFKKIRDILIL